MALQCADVAEIQNEQHQHLEENMAAADLELDDGDLAALDRVESRSA
jgi:diketogulonate reductase-like aldo/keto reductase